MSIHVGSTSGAAAKMHQNINQRFGERCWKTIFPPETLNGLFFGKARSITPCPLKCGQWSKPLSI